VEQSSLATVVTFPEHDVVAVSSIHVLKKTEQLSLKLKHIIRKELFP
jgi:hypothetical protein